MKKIILLNIFYFSFCTVAVKSAEKGGMPQLDPEFWVSQIFWLTITFGTLFLVLSKFILPRISKNLEQRRLQILENIETAEKQREQSEKNLKEFDEIILKSKNKAKEVMLAAREKVVSEITKKKMKLDEDLNSEIQNVEKEIIELKLSSPKKINSIASNITNEVIKRLIGTDVNVIFFGVLIYFKIPRKINEALDTKISEIKNELDESEKLRIETKKLLEDSQSKLSSAVKESKKIIDQAKNDSEKMVSELELKFENSAKIKKELSLSKIKQMKDEAVREIKNTSVDVAFSASENLIKNSIEKSKLDNLFQKNLEDAKDRFRFWWYICSS